MHGQTHKSPPGKQWKWDSFSTVYLTSNETKDAQMLFEECLDFWSLTTGLPTDKEEGAKLFTDLPPGFQIDKKTVFGLFEKNKLVGVIDSVDGYPQEGIWFIGLFLLHPDCRGKGTGKIWLDAYLEHARENGVKAVRLGVVEQNHRGRKFWESNGFVELDRRPPVRYGIIDNIVTVMEMTL